MPQKSKARAFNRLPNTPAISSPSQPKNEPPKPFLRAPKSLDALLPKLSKNHVYITSLDSHPSDFKRKIFLVPVLMNLAIVGLIIWRLKIISPYYAKIYHSMMGTDNEMTIDTSKTTSQDIGKEILRRAWRLIFDFMVYVFIWPWPRAFFLGQKMGNPLSWRYSVGFREKEIIVRRSRKWFAPSSNLLEEGKQQELLFNTVKTATDPVWMKEKTGYLMLNKDWDLDWKVMVFATKLMDKKEMEIDDFKTTILVHSEEFGWIIIESQTAGGSVKEEEGRRKIVAFKNELTALGKENLFFRWIELVQYESSLPGGFGLQRQKETMIKAKDLFEAQGVDFDKFWAKVGGMQGMPGMDDM